ncbi:MAG: DUF3842 family protein [Treponema sp.]|nr:DUF3842 family protein [Treponema sp.]
MNILVIDAQGGGLGKQLVGAIKNSFPEQIITAVGTNTVATSAMLKAGADFAATGENAVLVNTRSADLIIGPIGIIIADSLLGEVTPAMALAVSQSQAQKILIPFNNCSSIIVGVGDLSMGKLVEQAVIEVNNIISKTK